MKKILLLLALALPIIGFTSCSDDDDMPNIDVTVSFNGATRVDDTIYIVKDQPIDVTAINIVDNTKKGAVIGSAVYYWDYYRVGATIVAPYGMQIDTTGIPTGTHLLQISMSIYAVDYSPLVGLVEYKVVIVDSEDDIPTVGDVEHDPFVPAVIRSAAAETV